MLGITDERVYRYIDLGRLPAYKSGGVFLPRLPFVTRHPALEALDARLAQLWAPLSRRLNGTAIARRAGFYFLGYGYKPLGAPRPA